MRRHCTSPAQTEVEQGVESSTDTAEHDSTDEAARPADDVKVDAETGVKSDKKKAKQLKKKHDLVGKAARAVKDVGVKTTKVMRWKCNITATVTRA